MFKYHKVLLMNSEITEWTFQQWTICMYRYLIFLIAPYCQVSSPTDTSNFDVDDNDIRVSDAQPPSHNPGKEMACLVDWLIDLSQPDIDLGS